MRRISYGPYQRSSNFVEVGEGVILFECGFMNEDEVVNFERGRKCFMSIVFDHGFASFDEVIAGERKKFLSRVEKRFHSSILRFEIRTSEVEGEISMTLVDKIEWRHTSSRVSKIVICNFSGSKIFRPGGRIVSSIDTKILLESTISAFSLTISLRMISSRKTESSFSQREKFTPEVKKKTRITIRDNATRKTM